MFFEGIGKFELLKFYLSGFWFCWIDEKYRLVYVVIDEVILIVFCCYYY